MQGHVPNYSSSDNINSSEHRLNTQSIENPSIASTKKRILIIVGVIVVVAIIAVVIGVCVGGGGSSGHKMTSTQTSTSSDTSDTNELTSCPQTNEGGEI